MTVTYTSEVASCKWLGCFLKLLLRWKGSIYKLLWLDLIVYLSLYYMVYFYYRCILSDYQQKWFENFVRYCSKYANLIPLSFVMGFYVSLIMKRWWGQYTSIPSPNAIAILLGSLIKSKTEEARMLKRTILRYVCLSFTMTMIMISPKIKQRFPELENLIEAGLLTEDEKDIFEELHHEDYPMHNQYWLPLSWASSLTLNAKANDLIPDQHFDILDKLKQFRLDCNRLLDYDRIGVPLVYTQVVTLAVYSYFITTLISRQPLIPRDSEVIDFTFPIFTILEYFFYVGWLKVAETLINPFGEDDDDFDVSFMVDKHVHMSYLIVDQIQQKMPPLQKDKYWDSKPPSMISYTNSSRKYIEEEDWPLPSTYNMIIKDKQMFESDIDTIRKLRWKNNKPLLNRSKSYNSNRTRTHSEQEQTTTEEELELKPMLMRAQSDPSGN